MRDGDQVSGIRCQRVSPLGRLALQGRFGADKGAPGVNLSLRHPVSIVTAIARKDQTGTLEAAMMRHYGLAPPQPGHWRRGQGIEIHWCGPEQWYVIAERRGEGALHRELADRLAGLASCSDQSHGRIILRVTGPRARHVLAKGTPVDLHPSAFGPGRCAVTQMAHVGVHLAQMDDDAFELSVFRGFSENFWEWLSEMSAEYGYQVR